ncbi:UNVERIFIED_ORG: hypothetical protein J2Y78_003909 [Buttiauxella agrestis ATCC 33320]
MSDQQTFVIESPWNLLTMPCVNQLGTGQLLKGILLFLVHLEL